VLAVVRSPGISEVGDEHDDDEIERGEEVEEKSLRDLFFRNEALQ